MIKNVSLNFQQRLCLVCWLWKDVVSRMRTLARLNNFSRFDQRVHLRLPVAGSLNEGHGNEGFGVIVSVETEILLSGVGIFLPFGEENLSASMPDRIKVRVGLSEHAVSQIGPDGPRICDSVQRLTKKEIRAWNSEDNCRKLTKTEPRKSFVCIDGPWMSNETRARVTGLSSCLSSSCRSIHPYPVFFTEAAVLTPGVRYLLSMTMAWEQDEEEVARPVTTIWGFQVRSLFGQKSIFIP